MKSPETKICLHCKELKSLEEFRIHSSTGKRRNVCAKCQNKNYSMWEKKPENREKARKSRQEWRDKNRDKWNGYARKQREKPEMKEYRHSWQKENPEKCKAYRKKHRRNPQVRIREALRSRFAVLAKGYRRSEKARIPLGISIQGLKAHLESLFQPGMTWENYGHYRKGQPMKWNIDHRRPCASFDLTDPEQQAACFHYTNLQPLWGDINIQKSDKYE